MLHRTFYYSIDIIIIYNWLTDAYRFLSCTASSLKGSCSAALRSLQRWPSSRFHSLLDICWQNWNIQRKRFYVKRRLSISWKCTYTMVYYVFKTYFHSSYLSILTVIADELAWFHRKKVILTHRSFNTFFFNSAGWMLGTVELRRLTRLKKVREFSKQHECKKKRSSLQNLPVAGSAVT